MVKVFYHIILMSNKDIKNILMYVEVQVEVQVEIDGLITYQWYQFLCSLTQYYNLITRMCSDCFDEENNRKYQGVSWGPIRGIWPDTGNENYMIQ